MQSEMPFFEDELDALKAAVQALGGSKKVGQMLWQDKTIDAASRLLLDSLNPGRNEKLSLSQVMFILRAAKDAGHHGPFQWLAGEIGYDAIPVSKAEEADRMATVVEQASKQLADAIRALERIKAMPVDAGRPVVRVSPAN
ncbi:MAG: hypothetical protein ABFE08_01160 [Armatimonadia bacterium]